MGARHELAMLNELVTEHRSGMGMGAGADAGRKQLRESTWSQCQRNGLLCDAPLQTDLNEAASVMTDSDLPGDAPTACFNRWVGELT